MQSVLGPVPKPEGAASDVSLEHLAMVLRAKPQMVSFHFGLPQQEVVDTIKGAGIFVISSATTVAEAKMLERRGVRRRHRPGCRGRRSSRHIYRSRHEHAARACLPSCPRWSMPFVCR